jgi:hypothetical protein
MRDFDEFVQSLADMDLGEIIKALVAADKRAAGVWQAGRRAKLDSSAKRRSEDARHQVDRFERIIFFLRFHSLATTATAADVALCDILTEKLKTKGQWTSDLGA